MAFYLLRQPHYDISLRHSWRLPLIAVLAVAAAYLPLSLQLQQAARQTAQLTAPASHRTLPVASQPAATPAGGGSTASPAATVATSTPAVPTCTPSTFGTPASLDLTTDSAGLYVQADQPVYYQVYGDSAATIRGQIERCAPGATGSASAEFTGRTAYQLSWQYDDTATGDSCTLSDIRVGIHTAISLPGWQATSAATPGLASRWQAFVTGLGVHEQGHAAIDQRYAGQLLTDLNGLGAIGCGSLTTTVNSTVASDVAALNQANDTYDAQTNHGATQGAVLP